VKLLWNDKDGGPESRVWCWGIESKGLGSVLLMRFAEGSREAYHTHAFNAISWVLRGCLQERPLWAAPFEFRHHRAGPVPIVTKRNTFHQVHGMAPNTWVLSFRGPWVNLWLELNRWGLQTLTNRRQVLRTEAV
jgi:hypothetical protein